MAVPTISQVSPATGPATGGNIVTITGTNFQVYTPPAYGQTSGTATQTVEVLFSGVAAVAVWVWSSTELTAVPPEYPGDEDQTSYPAVTVTVRNIDEDGDPIPGETVSLGSAYTFNREYLRPPGQTVENPFAKVTRALIRTIKRQFILETGVRTHVDFSADGYITVDAGMPTVFLSNMRVVPDAYGYENEMVWVTQDDGSVSCWPCPTMHTVFYDIVGMSDNFSEFVTLMGVSRKLQRRNPYLLVDGDVPTDTTIRLPMAMPGEPETGMGHMDSGLMGFSGTLEVRRVPVLYLPPSYKTWPAESLQLETQQLEGSLVETQTLW